MRSRPTTRPGGRATWRRRGTRTSLIGSPGRRIRSCRCMSWRHIGRPSRISMRRGRRGASSAGPPWARAIRATRQLLRITSSGSRGSGIPGKEARMATWDVVIIGAGPNGLVAGAYLAKAGLRVLILEKRLESGGGLATEECTLPMFLHKPHSLYHMMVDYAPAYRDMGLM